MILKNLSKCKFESRKIINNLVEVQSNFASWKSSKDPTERIEGRDSSLPKRNKIPGDFENLGTKKFVKCYICKGHVVNVRLTVINYGKFLF